MKEHVQTVNNYPKDGTTDKFVFEKQLSNQVRHLKDHSETFVKSHKCNICNQSFSRVFDLKKHIHIIHEGRKDYECKSCGKSFTKSGSLKKHNHVVHKGTKDFMCESCGKSFSRSADVKRHMNSLHDDKNDINQKSLHESHLKIEISKNKHSKSYICEVCCTSFLTKKSFSNHFISAHNHHRQKEIKKLARKNDATTSLFQCDICEKRFDEKRNLRWHKEWHGEWIYECDICNKKLPSKQILGSHKNRHRQKSCRWNCGQTFQSHGGRMKHERTKHYQNKPMERICDICGKPCLNEIQLKEHKKTHMNPSERNDEYKCSVCFDIFESRRKMENHKRLLHAESICSKCGKTFIRDFIFEIHMKNCDGVKKVRKSTKIHSCDQCSPDIKYTARQFRRHLKSKHSTIFRCDECKENFRTKFIYDRHMKKHTASKCHLCNLLVTLHNGPQKMDTFA